MCDVEVAEGDYWLGILWLCRMIYRQLLLVGPQSNGKRR